METQRKASEIAADFDKAHREEFHAKFACDHRARTLAAYTMRQLVDEARRSGVYEEFQRIVCALEPLHSWTVNLD